MADTLTTAPSMTSSGEPPVNLLKPNPKPQKDYVRDPGLPLPSSQDVERGVISSLMQQPDVEILAEALEALPGAEAFHFPAYRMIYEVILDMSTKNMPIDLVPVAQVLADRGLIEKVGGFAAVSEIYNFSATSAHFRHYLHILTQKYTLRKIIESCTACITRAYEDQENVDPLLDEVEQRILAIRESKKDKEVTSMKDEVMKAIAEIEEMYNNKGRVTGLSSGFAGIDEKSNGFRGGEMIVIAARPSMGKTSLAMNIVEHIGIDLQKPVAVFSLEMPTNQLVLRLLCARAGLELSKLNGGFLSQKNDFPKLVQAASILAKSPIYIDDTPALSILELRAKARRLKKRYDIQFIAVDYLQLLRSTSRRAQDNRQIEIAEISSGLKALAKEINVPVLVLAQLNRGPENRGGKPRMSDLRESGAIEQDADMVGLLVREKYYADTEEEIEEAAGKAELDIAKNRNGPTGDVPLVFLEHVMRFVDRAREDEPDR